ncbi:MAG TPA: lipocalin family protein [Chitinophagaceae bacterium]
MKKNLFLAICVSTLLFQSCNKDKTETCLANVTSLSGTYKLTALKYKQTSTSPEADWMATVVQSCKKDDLYVLASDGAFSIQDAGTVCSPAGNYTGTWTFLNNEINMDGYYSGTVNSFNCSTLVFTQNDALESGDMLTATFVKQ